LPAILTKKIACPIIFNIVLKCNLSGFIPEASITVQVILVVWEFNLQIK